MCRKRGFRECGYVVASEALHVPKLWQSTTLGNQELLIASTSEASPIASQSYGLRQKAAAHSWRKHVRLFIALDSAANIARCAKEAILLFFVGKQGGEIASICVFVVTH